MNDTSQIVLLLTEVRDELRIANVHQELLSSVRSDLVDVCSHLSRSSLELSALHTAIVLKGQIFT